MMFLTRAIIIAILALLASPLSLASDDKLVRLATLEWPPYTGENLPGGGASVVVASAAFEAAGYRLEVSFYPWNRAISLAENDPRYDGYFPVYYTRAGEQRSLLSESMGSGPLGFAVSTDHRIAWGDLADLSEQRIGVVVGYNNTESFDAAMAAGELNTIESISDISNLRMLAAGRLDMAVIDTNVMDYLLDTQAPEIRAALTLHPRLLEDKTLHVAFSRQPGGETLQEAFNRGLKQIDVDALMQTYFHKIGLRPQDHSARQDGERGHPR